MLQLLSFLFLLMATSLPALFSQTLQVGMRLEYYSYPFPFSPPYFGIDTISLTITGDTLIQGATWLRLQGELEPCFFDDPVLIREEGPRVYQFHRRRRAAVVRLFTEPRRFALAIVRALESQYE